MQCRSALTQKGTTAKSHAHNTCKRITQEVRYVRRPHHPETAGAQFPSLTSPLQNSTARDTLAIPRLATYQATLAVLICALVQQQPRYSRVTARARDVQRCLALGTISIKRRAYWYPHAWAGYKGTDPTSQCAWPPSLTFTHKLKHKQCDASTHPLRDHQ